MEKKSLLSAAYEVLLASDKPLQFKELFEKSATICGLDLNATSTLSKMAPLYTQLSVDGRFAVFAGGMWDLKSRYKNEIVRKSVIVDDDDDDEGDDIDLEEKELLNEALGVNSSSDGKDDNDDSDDIDFDNQKKDEEDDDNY